MDNKNKTGMAAQGAVKPRVFNVRGKRVVLDRELAALIGIDTKYLKRIVKRNPLLFNGDELVFELTQEESLRCQTETEFDVQGDKFVTLNNGRGSNIKYLPYAFTEESVKMLEKVLKRNISVEFQEPEVLPAVVEKTWSKGTVELYYTNANISLSVHVEDETVWLAQEQMAQLFGTTTQNITMHIRNIFEEKEVEEWATCKDFLQVQTEGGREVRRVVKLYNLDIIISVGYRVKSIQGTRFRQWANKVLKQYVLQGHYYDSRLDAYDRKFQETDKRIDCIEEQVGFLIEANITPKVGLLSGNSVYDAHVFVSNLVERAEKHITIIDPYMDSSVLVLLSKRKPDVNVDIYYDDTKLQNKPAFNQDLALHNKQYPTVTLTHVDLLHDRFFIVDDETYHIGASIKDLGKKMFAFDTIPFTEQEVLRKIGVL